MGKPGWQERLPSPLRGGAGGGGATSRADTPTPTPPRKGEGLIGLLGAAAATPALAHPGHHETLSFAAQARHLLTEPDHVLAAAGLAVLAIAGTWQWRRARAKARK